MESTLLKVPARNEKEAKQASSEACNELYFEMENLCIYNTDFLHTECVGENSIDLVITSPPYNVDIRYNSFDDKIPYDAYLDFTREWLTKTYSLVKDDGRLCLNIPLDKNKGGQQSVYADFVSIAANRVKLPFHHCVE